VAGDGEAPDQERAFASRPACVLVSGSNAPAGDPPPGHALRERQITEAGSFRLKLKVVPTGAPGALLMWGSERPRRHLLDDSLKPATIGFTGCRAGPPCTNVVLGAVNVYRSAGLTSLEPPGPLTRKSTVDALDAARSR